ncbi:hypothetical protein ED312_18865 [Sinomicrobium pectinilyticum]|uniref:Uncharacterized protein n=1 Tax=Sinomicrobium pectinilyticum TaxID=1084421 RepID=A0A3N0DYX3_SINP1|nr:hypothetical protein ED312_18865 [Sinomicrobium pectinilyticum]
MVKTLKERLSELQVAVTLLFVPQIAVAPPGLLVLTVYVNAMIREGPPEGEDVMNRSGSANPEKQDAGVYILSLIAEPPGFLTGRAYLKKSSVRNCDDFFAFVNQGSGLTFF